MSSSAETMLPPAFLERLRMLLPPGYYADVLASFERPRPTSFRINTLLADRETALAALATTNLTLHPIPWFADAFWVPADERESLMETPLYKNQHLYIQNLSSMIPPLVLAPESGERILDLTAAPGSKTLQIACLMQGTGELAAVELVRGRYFKLRDNLKAQGATYVRTFNKNGDRVWRNRPEYFDRVLLDAPCSSEGRFHLSEPNSFAYWTPRKIKEMARKQQRLLFSAVQALRPGGTLVYSTCAFAPEENEGVLTKAFKTFGDALTVEPLGLDLPNMQPPLTIWKQRSFDPRLAPARRILPTETMQGFFVCHLRKHRSTLRH